jgi:hypothetical protein
MQCPRCQQDNLAHAKFCVECGTQFAAACAQCDPQLTAGAEKIRTSKATLEGEHKHRHEGPASQGASASVSTPTRSAGGATSEAQWKRETM